MATALTDFIAIRGMIASPEEFCQGIGPALSAGPDSTVKRPPNLDPGTPDVVDMPLEITPIDEDPDLAEGIWQGQNQKLTHENAYCDQLKKQIAAKLQRIETVWDKVIDVAEGLTADLLKIVTVGGTLYLTNSPQLAWLASILTDVGVKWAFDHLKTLLQRGNELLEGIKAENNKLLSVEKSRENYEYRETALARHREDIRIVLEQIRMTEKQIELTTQLEMKALLERLTDLAMRDDTVEFGDIRLHSRGKVVEF